MSDSVEVQLKVARLEERVEHHHIHIRERIAEIVELIARQSVRSDNQMAKVDGQIEKLANAIRTVTWTLGTIGVLIAASQTGVLETIKALLGGL